MINVANPSDSNIWKEEHKKLEKYKGPKEELEEMWMMKATVVIWALGAVTPKLHGWL